MPEGSSQELKNVLLDKIVIILMPGNQVRDVASYCEKHFMF